ncbi:MAG TPA: M28 family peptidase, partial [Gemmatimonadaceae bacterium]|nr:M28 family peptidase [Gemmatimonadaceae bacterium]
SKIVAALNMDIVPLNGRVRDLNVTGDNKSSLGPALAQLVRADGIRLTADAHPEAGHFYRSDHFSFAKVGVPSVSIGGGDDYVGRPSGWGLRQSEDYTAHRYHQPSDEYRSDFDLTGAAQLGQIVYRFGSSIANAESVPTWNADAEFKSLRDASRKGL